MSSGPTATKWVRPDASAAGNSTVPQQASTRQHVSRGSPHQAHRSYNGSATSFQPRPKPKASTWVRGSTADASSATPSTSQGAQSAPTNPPQAEAASAQSTAQPPKSGAHVQSSSFRVASEWKRGQGATKGNSGGPRQPHAASTSPSTAGQSFGKRKRDADTAAHASHTDEKRARLEAELRAKQAELQVLKAREEARRRQRELQREKQAAEQQQAVVQEGLQRGTALLNGLLTSKALAGVQADIKKQSEAKERVMVTQSERAAAVKRINEAPSDATPSQILQVPDTASLKDVTKAYKAMSVLVHPDKAQVEGAATAFSRVQHAYETLKENRA